jgi:hypothetical protein
MAQAGGRIRGQGTYGCVFQPPLLCRGKSIADPNKVGKITMPEDARNELAIAKYLATLPDAKRYTLPPEAESCVPRAKSKQKERDLGACDFLQGAQLTQTIQLTMPWGGYPLSRIDLDPTKFSFTAFMENVLAIGAFLALNDLCHFDIWGNNFLLDKQMVPRLIDFGFTFRPSELDADAVKFRWRQYAPDHDTEAPEVALMQAIDKGISALDGVVQLQTQKPAMMRLMTLFDVDPEDWATELLLWTKNSKGFQQEDWLSCWKLYWPGFDAWSIGAMLLEVYEVQVMASGVRHGSVEQTGSVKDVLRGLCRADPAQRLDAVEALSLLTSGSHALVGPGSRGAAWVSAKSAQRNRRSA